MKISNIARIVLLGVAIIGTLYVFTEGINQYNEIQVKINLF